MRTETGWLLDEDAPGPRKPLYLRGGPGMRVDADGPALRVRRPARAAQWFPLARLARVVSSGAVEWDCEALLACAEAGTPVVFVQRDGAVRGYLFGGDARSRDPHDLLYTRLRARLSRPGGMARYGVWRNAMIRAAVRALGAQLGQGLGDQAPHRLRQALAETRRRYAGPGPAALIEGRLRGWLSGLSAELLAEVGLDAARWSRLDFEFDLAGDLAELLGWALEAPVLAALEARFRGEPGALDLVVEAQLLGLFERHAPDLRRLGLDGLHQLRQWLET
ncbi:MAG: CRISPR-associated endonuclease Cas1 [Candidatus Competibacteraceae bacterium]